MKIAITGHRPSRLKHQEEAVKEWANKWLQTLKPSCVYCGMAQGTDQIIALAAKKLNIPIICCYPFPKKSYHPVEEYIMENNEVIYITKEYSSDFTYYLRDKYMVDNADLLLCVWDRKPYGGTFLTREYALEKDIPIIELNII